MIRIILTSFLVAFSTPSFAATKKFDNGMKEIVEHYLKIQSALAKDSVTGVKDAASNIQSLAKKLSVISVSGEHAKNFKKIPSTLAKHAIAIKDAKNINSAREHFKKLSEPMTKWARISKPSEVDIAYCSMAKASWLQKKGDIKNPYYGKKMLSCGTVVK